MIPVFQTRTDVERLGNCAEACLASILELPLDAIPDRTDYLPADWLEQVEAARAAGRLGDLELDVGPYDDALQAWLNARGLALLELTIGRGGISETDWLETFVALLGPGYWIGTHRTAGEYAHAVVYQGSQIVHNPHPGLLGAEGLGELIAGAVLLAGDPARAGRPAWTPTLAERGVAGEIPGVYSAEQAAKVR
jgi:hypothetical protein